MTQPPADWITALAHALPDRGGRPDYLLCKTPGRFKLQGHIHGRLVPSCVPDASDV